MVSELQFWFLSLQYFREPSFSISMFFGCVRPLLHPLTVAKPKVYNVALPSLEAASLLWAASSLEEKEKEIMDYKAQVQGIEKVLGA